MAQQTFDHPHVVVFFTDQQRRDTSGLPGALLNLTPNFDRTARQGTHMYQSFTNRPGRFSAGIDARIN